MGILLWLPRHSATSFIPKTAGSGTILSFPSASERARKYSGGMAFLAFQLLTTDSLTPTRAATAPVSPRVSMMDSAVRSMPQNSSRSVNSQVRHPLEIDFTARESLKCRMRSTPEIAKRLEITRKAIGISAADLCRLIKCKPNRWSQYESGDRKITQQIANDLCDEFSLTLDWIYRGDPAGLPLELRMKISKLAA